MKTKLFILLLCLSSCYVQRLLPDCKDNNTGNISLKYKGNDTVYVDVVTLNQSINKITKLGHNQVTEYTMPSGSVIVYVASKEQYYINKWHVDIIRIDKCQIYPYTVVVSK